VIHRKKNYWFYKDASCHNIWPCDFTDVTAFSSLFFLALHHFFFLYIFFLLWLFVWLFNFFTKFFFMGTFSPEYCFFWLFLWPFLPGSSWWRISLALHRAPISSHWFFMWHSLRPSSTQLLVCNHSGGFVLIDTLTWLGSFFF